MPTKKKLHWTQTPEGKEKLKTMHTPKPKVPWRAVEVNQNSANTVSPTQKLPNQFIDSLKKVDSSWQLERFMEEFFAKGVRLAGRKNHDYAGNGDPFFNFRRFGIQGFIVRMGDKFARLETLATHGYLAVTEESYQDTLIDIANYAALLAAFLYNQQIEAQEQNAKSR
jgi:hypothetical protein